MGKPPPRRDFIGVNNAWRRLSLLLFSWGNLGRDEGQLAARSCLRDDAEIGFSHDTYDGITASHWTVSHEHDGLTGRWYLYGTQGSTFARKRSKLGKDSLTSQAGAHPIRL